VPAAAYVYYAAMPALNTSQRYVPHDRSFHDARRHLMR